jgi:hypothetical protein
MKSTALVIGLFTAILGASEVMAAPPEAPNVPSLAAPSPALHADQASIRSLMTPEELAAHRKKLHSFTSVDDCKAYVADVAKNMTTRAKEKGIDTSKGLKTETCARAAKRGKQPAAA